VHDGARESTTEAAEGEAASTPVVHPAGAALLLVLVVALFHGPSLQNDFVYDDRWTVVENPFIRAPGNALAVFGPEPARLGLPDAGRPTLLLTEILDHALWGLSPRGFHLQNVIWHGGVVLLFFFAARRLLGPGLVPLAAAALFAVHPLHVEAVSAINYREDLLAAFFVLLSLMCVGAARGTGGVRAGAENGGAEAGRRARRLALRSLAFAVLALGSFAKENASIAPFLLVLLDVCRSPPGTLRATLRRGGADYAVLTGAVLVPFFWRAWVMGAAGIVSRTAELPHAHLDPVATVPRAAAVFLQGVGQLLLPLRFSPEYAETLPGRGGTVLGWAALVALAAISVALFRARGRYPWPAFGALGGLVAYVPNLGLVPLTNLRADRYFYLPALPLTLGLAWVLVAVLERSRRLRERSFLEVPALWLAVACLALLLGIRTLRQGRVWRTDLALWAVATRTAPDSPRAWLGLAEARLRTGQTVAALTAVERSLALADDPHGRELLGLVLLEQGDLESARAALELALAQRPLEHHRAGLLNNLGYVELRLGRRDRALERFTQAARLAPWYDRPALNAARAYLDSGDHARALSTLRNLVAEVPTSAEGWKQLGLLLHRLGDSAAAAEAFNRANALGVFEAELAGAQSGSGDKP
jgi:protein O-mannosyl-transferase